MTFKLRKPNPKGEFRVSLGSIKGYKSDSPDRDNDVNIIGTDEHGNTKLMKPGKNYRFPGNKITEHKA